MSEIKKKKKKKDFTVIQTVSDGTLAGKPAKTLAFRATIPVQYGPNDVREQILQVQSIWAINGNTAYVITYKAPPEDFATYLPVAQQIVNSFQFTS